MTDAAQSHCQTLPTTAVVEAATLDVSGTITLTARVDHPPTDLSWEPGQFNMVHVFGNNEVPISVSRIADPPGTITHTIRGAGPASSAFLSLAPGDRFGLRGPFGRGWPMTQTQGKDVIVVAGGLGLAPLRPAIEQLVARADGKRKVFVAYGTRTPDTMIYQDDVDRWSAAPHATVLTTVDQAPSGWHGAVGVVTGLFPQIDFPFESAVALICGPEVMMRASASGLLDLGVSPSRLFLSLERNMKCATGFCGHCQFGPHFLCKDGPVFAYPEVERILAEREI